MQRVAGVVWVAFCPPRDASPYSSEDDVDDAYRYGREEEHERGVWDKGLEERFGRIVTIVDAKVSASPSPSPSSGLTLTLERTRENTDDNDDGVALLTDAQIQEGCAFLRTVATPPSPPPPRYSSFPPTPPPAYSPRGNTKAQVLILAPRTRAVDAFSLAAAYVVARGWGRVQGVDTPPRTPTPSSSSAKVLLRDTTASASISCADARSHCEATTTTPPSTGIPSPNLNPDTNSNSDAQEDIVQERELDLTHPIAEWSARVIPLPPLPLQPELDDAEYTPVHDLLMRLHDSDWGSVVGDEEEEGDREEEEEEEGGLRDEWRGVLSWEGMWRVWEGVRSLSGGDE